MTDRIRPEVFVSYTWADETAVDLIERALVRHGLVVFRDKDMHVFDGITENLRRALDSASVLLAFYSRRYPTRYACQWELTRAYLAARRLGDPRHRVLVVNPEPDGRHIAPVELTDAGYLPWRPDANLDRLAGSVADAVHRAGGVPLGGAPARPHSDFHDRLTRPRRFVGRYSQLWAVHGALQGALQGGRLRGTRRPESDSVVAITAPPGMGKTVLAEQYGFLFRDAYPGGMVWTSLAGDGPGGPDGTDGTDPGVRAYFGAALARLAADRFGLDLHGMDLRQAKATVAGRLDRGEDLLWVIDGAPDGVGPDVLDELIVPSRRVHTVLTMRTAPAGWLVRQVPVPGLTAADGEELFRAHWPDLDRAERQAIARLVDRCHGHPLVLVPAVRDLRAGQGTGALDRRADQAEHTDQAESVIAGLIPVIRARGRPATVVLGVAGQLAHAPFGGELLVECVAEVLGAQAPVLVAEALGELDAHGLLHRVGHGTGRQTWQLPALVARAVRRELDQMLLDALAVRAAWVLRAALGGPDVPLAVYRHALALAARPAVAPDQCLDLVRAVAAGHEDRGNLLAARHARSLAVSQAGELWRSEDALAAARLAVLCGDADSALGHTGVLIERARARRDVRTEYWARLIAATAHDLRGEYPRADAVFHRHELVAGQGAAPVWLSADERRQVGLARVRALRLRGDHRAAVAILDGLLPDIRRADPFGAHRGPWPVAMIELAHLQLRSGDVIAARQTAARIIAVFDAAGLPRHPMARKAATVDAEGELTEAGARPDRWFQVSRRIKRVLDESAEWFGPDNPLTLDLMVLYGQALVDGSRPLDAFAVLADAEARAARSLGGDHPLALRIRQCTGLATMGLADWPAAATIFEDLLRRQDSVLGRQHPDSRLTRTRLAECRARSTGRPAPARVLTRMPSALLRVVNRVDDAARRRWA